jgi:hypothetical protein
MLKAWLDESYRAQAPKKLIKQLDASGPRLDSPVAAQSAEMTAADAVAREGKAAWAARSEVYTRNAARSAARSASRAATAPAKAPGRTARAPGSAGTTTRARTRRS